MIPLDGAYDAFPAAGLTTRFSGVTRLTSPQCRQRLKNSSRPLEKGSHASERSHSRKSGSAPEWSLPTAREGNLRHYRNNPTITIKVQNKVKTERTRYLAAVQGTTCSLVVVDSKRSATTLEPPIKLFLTTNIT